METAETATIDGNVVATWKRGTQKRVDLDELREKFPDVAREVTHETQPRRFLLKDDKANVGSS
jgi:predicted phage-related endonuclease